MALLVNRGFRDGGKRTPTVPKFAGTKGDVDIELLCTVDPSVPLNPSAVNSNTVSPVTGG